MADPAIEAAHRAWERSTHGLEATAYLAAQEALKPIRARHYRVFIDDGDVSVCASCWGRPNGPKDWPCPDALDAYSTEELDQ